MQVSELIQPTKLYSYISKLLGQGIKLWEPETIWIELKRAGIDIKEINRCKLLAAITVLTTSQFYYNVHCFSAVVSAFNELPFMPGVIVEHEPKDVTWAVRCIEDLLKMDDQEYYPFDYEVENYIALVFHNDGYLLVPKELSWSQDNLDRFNKNLEYKDLVKNDPNHQISILQNEKLDEIREYLKYRSNIT